MATIAEERFQGTVYGRAGVITSGVRDDLRCSIHRMKSLRSPFAYCEKARAVDWRYMCDAMENDLEAMMAW